MTTWDYFTYYIQYPGCMLYAYTGIPMFIGHTLTFIGVCALAIASPTIISKIKEGRRA